MKSKAQMVEPHGQRPYLQADVRYGKQAWPSADGVKISL
jgi:hypothetical protein